MATFPPPSSPRAFEPVDLRGGYPLADEALFALATLAAAHLTALGDRAYPPRNKDDAGRMLLSANDLFAAYADIECAMVGNAGEPMGNAGEPMGNAGEPMGNAAAPRGFSYFLSTSAGRTADLSPAAYDDLIRTQDFWHPPARFHLCETSVDREVKQVLEAKGARPFI